MIESNIKVKRQKGDISTFLDKCRVKSGENFTHASMGGGVYDIPFDKIDDFFLLYMNAVKDDIPMHIVERHENIGPIVIDVDLRFDLGVTSRQYKKKHVKDLVRAYMDEIEHYFIIDKSNRTNKLRAFILERDAPRVDKNVVKDGIHIVFPYIISVPNVQYTIRNNILKKCPEIFKDMPLKNPMSDVIDKAVIKSNAWTMYMSSKPGCDPFKLSYILDSNLADVDLTKNKYKLVKLPKLLSIRGHKERTRIKEEYLDEFDKADTKKKMTNIKRKNNRQILEENDVKDIANLVNILADDRALNYQKWTELGWCLHNIDPNCEDLLDIWKEFSQQFPDKYDEAECDRLWDSAKEEGLTIGSLHYWAQTDDPEKYKLLKRISLDEYIEKSINCTNYDIAKVLHEMYKYNFVCASAKEKIWFEYKNHRWIEIDDAITLRKKISVELVNEYCRIITCNNTLLENPIEENAMLLGDLEFEIEADNTLVSKLTHDDKEELIRKNKIFAEITCKLKTTSFKDNIMRESRELFYNQRFLQEIDMNNHLLCFNNGIYDLKRDEFRDGNPEDMISFSTNIDYVPFDQSAEEVEEIFNFISKIQPKEELRDYMLTLLSSYLEGFNSDEHFNIWIGSGSNGKSKVIELFEDSFGDYCVKFPISMLVGKRSASGAPNPELMNSKGKRAGTFQEPNPNDVMNIGLMKEYTGGDKLTGRGMYAKVPITFKPQFQLLLACNHFPGVPGDDHGTWRRLCILEFNSKFCDNPDPDNPNEFKKDKKLSEQFGGWKEHFLSILIEYHKTYVEKGLHIPEEVTKYTKQFQKRSDRYMQFLDKVVEETSNVKDMVDISDLYEDYKEWVGDYYCGEKPSNKIDFIEYLEKKFKNKKLIKKKNRELKLCSHVLVDSIEDNDNTDDDTSGNE